MGELETNGIMAHSNSNQNVEHIEPTLEELRELGSAEFNAMTFTPPGGSAMTLDEYAEYQKRKAEQKAESRRVLQKLNADEDRRRRDMKNMTLEERAAYLKREDEEQRAQETQANP